MSRLTSFLGKSRAGPDATLPARVVAAIGEQQDLSERLIGWIQLAVVLTFWALFLIAPKPYPMDLMVMLHQDAVPWVLGVYLAFTGVRLRLSYRGRLPEGLVAASVVVDMALLLVTIWTFHLKYQQPPSFYLKAPTLLYVFIFIALRALRFEVFYILLAGGVAVLGWALMVAYVVFADPSDPMITRNYVEYLTSNSVLLGAEFDKIISIAMVTAILALAVARARALLVRSVREGTAARSLARYFPPAVARLIASAERELMAGHGARREAAILTFDLRGFTAFARAHSTEDVVGLLTEYQARLVPVIDRHRGVVDKFLGDGILATFGAVEPSATHAADALRAVGRPEVRIGAAVASGEVMFCVIGEAERLEYTVLGNPVNLSAKLESHNKAEGVRALTTKETYATALVQGYRPPTAKRELKARRVAGVDAPIELVVLAG